MSEMNEEFFRKTEPSGALDPPSRKPPTTVGLAVAPRPQPGRPARAALRSAMRAPNWLGRWLSRTFAAVDALADATAEVLQLRPKRP